MMLQRLGREENKYLWVVEEDGVVVEVGEEEEGMVEKYYLSYNSAREFTP